MFNSVFISNLTLRFSGNTNKSSRRNSWLPNCGLAALAVLSLISFANPQPANAAAVRTGFDFNTLGATDDGSSGAVSLPFSANFFGQTFNSVYVNNNGNITFDSPLSSFTPFGLTSTQTAIIAPFFADVDTRGTGSGVVTYGTGTVDGHAAFGVDYPNVGYYSSGTDKLNNFQVVLIDRSDTGTGNFDIEYNYNQIQWETGNASGGTDGLGGDSARVGYSNGTGDPGTSFELAGSGVNGAFLDSNTSTGLIYNSLNSDVAGRYLFQARNGTVVTSVPEPSVELGTLAFGAFGAIYLLNSKRKQKLGQPF